MKNLQFGKELSIHEFLELNIFRDNGKLQFNENQNNLFTRSVLRRSIRFCIFATSE